MFFIGIFGIEEKEKKIREIKGLNCKECNKKGSSFLLKRYTYFHFFFIPLFKWNIRYYVACDRCNMLYSISQEKGRKTEKGEEGVITYWDLKEVHNHFSPASCSGCGNKIDSSFMYCPYCGTKIH